MKMKRWLFISFTICCFIASVFIVIYHSLPGIIEHYYIEKSYTEANLEIKQVKIGHDKIEYGVTGSGPTILMVHGFQGDKRSWIPYIKRLNKYFRIVALDLAGHGNSSAPKTLRYDLESQARFVEVFVRKAGLEKFHLIGTSMGGGIATFYASMYPHRVEKLILLNPYGASTLSKSAIEMEIEKGNNLFFPESVEEFDAFIAYIRGKPLVLSNMFKEYLLGKLKEKQAFYRKVFSQLISSEKVEKYLPKIQAKTLVLVGENDQILHHSSVESYKKHVPNITTKTFKDGSHVFSGELLDQAVEVMTVFLDDPSDKS